LKPIILIYLNKNYRFTYSTFNSYLLKDRIRDEDIKLSDVISSLKVIFTVSDEEIMTIFDEWADSQSILYYQRLFEIQERLYKNGITIKLSPQQINTLIEDEEIHVQNLNKIVI
jgi:hypothetical protein